MISTDRYSIPFTIGEEQYKIGIADVIMDKDIERGDVYIDDYFIGDIYDEDGEKVEGIKWERIAYTLCDDDDFYQAVYDRELSYQEEMEVERSLDRMEDR